MGLFDIFKKKKAPSVEPVPVSAQEKPLSLHTDRLPGIKALGEDPSDEALDNLMRLLQFDARGEVAIHASLALAGRADKAAVKQAIRACYNDAPPQCKAGDPPQPGDGIFPKMRLLYPIAWMGDGALVEELLEGSGPWPGAGQGKKACYDLIGACAGSSVKVAERLVFFEYLDEAGNRAMMDQANELYPAAGLTAQHWSTVRGG